MPSAAPADGTIGLLPPLPAGATELTARRTETSRTYRDATGRETTELYTGPVFFRPEGKATLEPVRLGYLRNADGKGAVSGKAPMKVTVTPATDPAGFLSVEAAGHTITYRPLSAKGLPASSGTATAIDGGAADLKDVIPGVDLRVLARARTASVFFILDRPADAAKLSFAIDAPGLTAAVNADGQVVFTDAAGTEVARMSHPWAMDTTPDTTGLGSGRMTGAVTVALTGTTSPYTATVTVDATWLKDAVYPVYVDPTLALADTSGSDDAFVNAGSNIVYGEYCRPDSPYYCELWLGQSPAPTTDVASVFMKWSSSLFTGLGFDSASLQVFPYHQYMHSTPKNTWVWEVSGSWSESTLKYSNRPGVTGSARTGDTAEDTWSDINILPIVREWAVNEDPNYGVRIDENGNGYTYWKRLISVEQAGSYVHVPRIVYTSHTLGATPIAVGIVNPGDILRWTYANGASKAQTQYDARITTDAACSASIVASSGKVSQSVAAGATGSWTVPALTDMTRYYWCVRVSDGTGWSTRTVAAGSFVYDTRMAGEERFYSSAPFDLGGGWDLEVGVHNGEARLARDLFSIPSYGPGQALELTYSSADADVAGPFGQGWSSNLTQTLSVNASTGLAVWRRADGGRTAFTGSDTAWATVPGHHETLTRSGAEYTVTAPDHSSLVFDATTGRLKRVVDRFGVALVIVWGASSITATDASGHATTLGLTGTAPSQRVSTATDSAGRTWGFLYTGSTLTRVTDPALRASSLEYDTGSRLTALKRMRTPFGGTASEVVWALGYDASGRVTTVADPVGGTAHATTFAYLAGRTDVTQPRDAADLVPPSVSRYRFDAAHPRWVASVERFATRTTDPAPVSWTTTYGHDAAGNVTSVTGQVDATHTVTSSTAYDSAGFATSETDPLGIVTTYTYSADGYHDLQVTRVTGTGTPVLTMLTVLAYDTSHRVCREVRQPTVDPLSITCTSTLPSTEPDEDVAIRYTWDPHNQMTSQTDPVGIITGFGYDLAGNQISVTRNAIQGQAVSDSVNVTTGFTYDPAGNVATEVAPVSAAPPVTMTTTYAYDQLGRGLTSTIAGDATTPATRTVHEYDEFGDTVSVTDQICPSGGNCAWTSLTRVSTVIDPLGAPTRSDDVTFASDGSSSATATTMFTPDLAGDVVSTTDPDGVVTTSTYDGLGHLLSSSASGITATYVYDGLGRETHSVEPDPDGDTLITDQVLDATGHVVRLTESDTADGNQSITDYSFDGLGRKSASTDPTGFVTVHAYDALGRQTVQTTGTSATDTTYDKAGRALSQIGPYDAAHGPAGAMAVSRTFDALGRQTAETIGSATTVTAYNARGDTIATVNALGVVDRISVNVQGATVETIGNCTDSGTLPPEDPATCAGTGTANATTNVVTTITYSADGAILRTTQVAGGVTTETTYDGGGRLQATIIDAGQGRLNLTTSHEYDELGREIRVVAPSGVATATVYDDQGLVCRTIENATIDPQTLAQPCTDAIAAKTATANVDTMFAHDASGNLTDETAPNGMVTHHDYSASGLSLATTTDYRPGYAGQDATVNATTTTSYDAAGRVVLEVDPTGTATATAYNSDGEVCRTVRNPTVSLGALSQPCTDNLPGQTPSQNVDTRYGYSPAGDLTVVIAPSPADNGGSTTSVTTLYAYDQGELCRVVENAVSGLDLTALADPCRTAISAGRTVNVDTQYERDAGGNIISQVVLGDPANGDPGGTTTFHYDSQGTLETETDPDGHTTEWEHDRFGNRVSQLDPDGSRTWWSYDAANRLCRRTSVVAGVTLAMPADPCATTSAVAGAATDTRYVVDVDGNTTSAIDTLAGRAITATYDALSRPLAVAGSGPGAPAWPTTYTYPSFTQQVRSDPAGTHTATLDARGRVTALADPLHPSGSIFRWSYTADGEVAARSDPTGNTTTFSSDPLGRTTSITTTGAAGCPDCATLTYGYNAAGSRLSSHVTITGGAANGTTTYASDALGRLLAYVPPTTPTQAYAWNAQPDRRSIQTGGGAAVTTAFDGASRVVPDALHDYDGEGRVTKAPGRQAGRILTMTWDPLGRLTQVVSTIGGTGTTTTYTYDPLDRLGTISAPSGTTTFAYVGLTDAVAAVTTTPASGPTTTRYLETGPDGTELLEYDAVTRVPVYLGADAHGDTVWTAGASGAPTGSGAYDPFGNPSGTITTVARWQGSYQDASTGLYYVIARWYDPVSGAFLSEDPVPGDEEHPQGLDPYAYGRGGPVNATDPDGRVARVGDATFVDGWKRVAKFHEPGGWSHNFDICVSGSLRVVLAFTSPRSTNWDRYVPSQKLRGGEKTQPWWTWPKDATRPHWPKNYAWDASTTPPTRVSGQKGGRDTWGQGYMLYLAYQVRLPDDKRSLWKIGARYSLPGTGSAIYFGMRFANFETWGEAKSQYDVPGGYVGTPFSYRGNATDRTTFDADVAASINADVPVAVGVLWSLAPDHKIGLPSWKNPGTEKWPYYTPGGCANTNALPDCHSLHSVAIIGYDASYLYYVDTCWKSTGCRNHGQPEGAANSGHANVWKIRKSWMYKLMHGNEQGGYYRFNDHWPWSDYVHAPW